MNPTPAPTPARLCFEQPAATAVSGVTPAVHRVDAMAASVADTACGAPRWGA